VSDPEAKHELLSYLRGARDTLLLKLEERSEYDIRRPMTPSGTNLPRRRQRTVPEWETSAVRE
jgi:hypothetical protein